MGKTGRFLTILIGFLFIFGCKAAPVPAGRAASVRLLLDPAFFQHMRRIQVAEKALLVQVTMEAPDILRGKYDAQSYIKDDGTLSSVTFENVPTGKNRLVSLYFKNADGFAIPGSTLRSVFDLTGNTVVSVNWQTTPAGNVFQRLFDRDRALAGQLDCHALQAQIERIKSDQGLPHYGLIDDSRLFDNVREHRSFDYLVDIAPPPVIQPAVLQVTLKGLPESVGASVRICDPISPLQTDLRNGTHLIQPIWPLSGTLGKSPQWLIQITAPGYGMYQRSDISFTPGHTEQLSLDFNDNSNWKGWQGREYVPANAARGEMGAFIQKDKLFMLGGYNDSTYKMVPTLDCFDPVLNKWLPHSENESTFMNPALRSFALANDNAAASERVFVMGGISSLPPGRTVSDNFKVLYPDGVWDTKDKGPLPRPRAYAGAALVEVIAGGIEYRHKKIFLVGGITSGNGLVSSVDVYDCFLSAWETVNLPSLPHPRADLAVCSIGDFIYAIGGTTGWSFDTPVAFTERFDTNAKTWKSCAPLPTPRFGLSTVVLNGKIYAIGGVRSNPFNSSILERVPTVEVYDPEKDAWSPASPLHIPRAHCAAVAIKDFILVAAGEDGAPVLLGESYRVVP